MKTTISIVLPAHNEAPNIENVVNSCAKACEAHFSDYEVIVVNDGSTDSTAELAGALAQADSHVKLVSHHTNLGYGAALRSGFDAAGNEWIFFTDSDGQFDPASMADFLPLMEDADIIAGYRDPRADNAYRIFMGKLYSKLMDIFFDVGLKDVNCAFKFIRADFLKSLELTSEGAMINTEIMAHARKKGLRIVEKGVKHHPRRSGEQSGGTGRVILKALKEYSALYKRLKRG